MTKQAIEAGTLLGIEVLDYVVIGERRHASLKQMGWRLGNTRSLLSGSRRG